MIDDDVLRARVRAALDSIHRPAPRLLERSMETVQRPGARRMPAAVAWVAISAVIVVAGVLLLLQREVNRNQNPATSPTPQAHAAVYTLTATNRLIAFDASLHKLWQRDVAPPPAGNTFATGSVMGLNRAGSVVYTIPLVDIHGGTEIRSFDATTGRPLGTVVLSRGNARYRALAAGPGGVVYAVGEDTVRILVSVVDASRGVMITTQATRTVPSVPDVGIDVPYQAEVSPDGRRLYYSLGGADLNSAGIDWVDVSGTSLVPCTPGSPGAPCLTGVAYGFDLSTGHLLAIDFDRSHLVEADTGGGGARRLPSGLNGSLQDVVVAPGGGSVIMLGVCGETGGLSRISLDSGQAQVVVSPQPAGTEPPSGFTCGTRAALLPDGTLVAGGNQGNGAIANAAGMLEVIDPRTGRVVRQAATGADPVDLVVAS